MESIDSSEVSPHLSPSVQSVARELSPKGAIDATEIMRALLRRHAEYGSGSGREVSETLMSTSQQRGVSEWIREVAALTTSAVETLHGRLLIVGLAKLDDELGSQLRANGFLALVESELREPIDELLGPVGEGIASDAVEAMRFQSDEPALVDALGRLPFARYLAAKLRYLRQEQDGPFLINLDGRWGSGKTSVLNLLEQELRKSLPPDEGPSGWIVVRFNAWQQQRFDPPWWPLIAIVTRGIRSQLWRSKMRWRATSLWLQQAGWRARIGFTRHMIAAIVLAALVWVSFGQVPAFEVLGVPSDALSNVGAIGALLTAAYAFARSIAPASQQAAEGFIRSARDPIRSLSGHFRGQVRNAGAPVAIFIDDIDRCHEGYVVGLIEGVQTLLRDAPLVYVVASDRRWIETSFEVSYKHLSPSVTEPGRPLGHLFLHKVFQLSVSIPPIPPDAATTYWGSLLGDEGQGGSREAGDLSSAKERLKQLRTPQGVDAALRDAEDNHAEYPVVLQAALERLAAPDMQRQTEFLLAPFVNLLERNPRAMKRLVNAYDLQRATFRLSHGPGSALPDQAGQKLALWTILSLRWPLLADYLQIHPDGVDWINEVTQDDGFLPADPKLRALFELPDVRRVVKGEEVGVSLDAGSVRAFTGVLGVTKPKASSSRAGPTAKGAAG
jgi:KAP family P-loop domain